MWLRGKALGSCPPLGEKSPHPEEVWLSLHGAEELTSAQVLETAGTGRCHRGQHRQSGWPLPAPGPRVPSLQLARSPEAASGLACPMWPFLALQKKTPVRNASRCRGYWKGRQKSWTTKEKFMLSFITTKNFYLAPLREWKHKPQTGVFNMCINKGFMSIASTQLL